MLDRPPSKSPPSPVTFIPLCVPLSIQTGLDGDEPPLARETNFKGGNDDSDKLLRLLEISDHREGERSGSKSWSFTLFIAIE